MYNNVADVNMDYIFTFGKYKGVPIEIVIEENPQYIIWANYTITKLRFSKEILTKVGITEREANNSSNPVF